MTAKRYYVIGGEYADISFTLPAPGSQLETHGPFESERDAKVCWRDLTGKTVDDKLLAEAGEAALQGCKFIADVRGTVPYKRELMKVYVRRAVRAAMDGKDGLH